MASNSETFSDAQVQQDDLDTESDESSKSFHSLNEQIESGTLGETEFAKPEEMNDSKKAQKLPDCNPKTNLNADKESQDKYFIDEDYLKDLDSSMSEKEKKFKQESALQKKTEGNDLFKKELYDEAAFAYTEALLLCPFSCVKDRAILYANRAAARSKIDKESERKGAVKDCSQAILLDPSYFKAILRRANLHIILDNLDEALKDYKKILEMDPLNVEAQQAVKGLPKQIEERNEKLKKEMMGSSVPRTSAKGKEPQKPWWNPDCEKAAREKKRCLKRLRKGNLRLNLLQKQANELQKQANEQAYKSACTTARRVMRWARHAYDQQRSAFVSSILSKGNETALLVD